jgi:selenophosphate synthetase-related protein
LRPAATGCGSRAGESPPTCWSKGGISRPAPSRARARPQALAVNLSDLAAIGAAPRWALLAIGSAESRRDSAEGVRGGFFALAERFGIDLVGAAHARAATT